MVDNRFVLCSKCNEVHNFTEYDDLPMYEYDEVTAEYAEKSMNDAKLFLMRHHGHQMQELRKQGESYVQGKSYRDPNSIVYYNVTNGLDNFVLKKHRTSANAPVSYEILSGQFKVVNELPFFDYEKISYYVTHPKWGNNFLSENLDQFLDALKQVLLYIEMENLDDSMFKIVDPQTVACYLPDPIVKQLVMALEEKTYEKVPETAHLFIEEHNVSGGCLNILYRKNIEIISDQLKSSVDSLS